MQTIFIIFIILVTVILLILFIPAFYKAFNKEMQKAVEGTNKLGEEISDAERLILNRNALFNQYHSQGIDQSKVSFWFSLIAASIGFAIIAYAIISTNDKEGITSSKPLISLISGTVIEAVSSLFFVQSNKARDLMNMFFDKLNDANHLTEALKLVETIEDSTLKSKAKTLMVFNFVDIINNNNTKDIDERFLRLLFDKKDN